MLQYAHPRSSGLLAYTIPEALEIGPRALKPSLPRAGRLSAVVADLVTTPLAGSVIVDILLNGTTIFTDQGQRPEIVAGATASDIMVPAVQDAQRGDVLTFVVDEIGAVAPEFVASPSVTGASGTATITRPAEAATGDLIFVAIRTSYVSGSPITVTPHAGFTEIGSQFNNASGSISLNRYWKIDADEPTLTFTTPGNNFAGGRVAWVRHALAATPIGASAASNPAFGTAFTIPSVTPAGAHELLLASAHFGTSRTLSSEPAGLVLRNPASAATSHNQWLWTQQLATADPTATPSGSFSASDHRIISVVTVRPDPAATGVEKGSTLMLSIALE